MLNFETYNQEDTHTENEKPINYDYLDKKLDGGLLQNSYWAEEIKKSGYNTETQSILDPEFQKQLARNMIEVSEFKSAGFPVPIQDAPEMPKLDERLSIADNFFVYLSQKYPKSFPLPISAEIEDNALSPTMKSMDTRLYESWLHELTMLIQEAYDKYEDPKSNDYFETLKNQVSIFCCKMRNLDNTLFCLLQDLNN